MTYGIDGTYSCNIVIETATKKKEEREPDKEKEKKEKENNNNSINKIIIKNSI